MTRDGPFSDYTGYDRTIVLLAGSGFELTFGDGTVARVDGVSPIYSCSGERPVTCRLLGSSVRVFNTITRQTRYRQTVDIVSQLARITVAAGDRIYVHGSGTLCVVGPDEAVVDDVHSGALRIVRIRQI
jgi:environmental stress-induced protein Ves